MRGFLSRQLQVGPASSEVAEVISHSEAGEPLPEESDVLARKHCPRLGQLRQTHTDGAWRFLCKICRGLESGIRATPFSIFPKSGILGRPGNDNSTHALSCPSRRGAGALRCNQKRPHAFPTQPGGRSQWSTSTGDSNHLPHSQILQRASWVRAGTGHLTRSPPQNIGLRPNQDGVGTVSA
jgi:hypothetical protein